ncbi:hypothetical protein [Halosegnis sp.]|uniref:DUF7405 family protein n=1 Tax=Halosegnis sp. TaxID=2864959 RepID=UPI0035D500D8
MASRRGLLRHLAALSGAAGLSGCSRLLAQRAEAPTADLPPNPLAAELPTSQHAWNDRLHTDAHGNHVPPRHYRILLLELEADISKESAATVERAMRTLEAAYDYRPSGLLHALAWGSGYFERLDALEASPIRHPKVLSRVDTPDLLAFDAALVLASDIPSHLAAVDSAMFRSRTDLGGDPVNDRLGDVFRVAERRTGFLGEGLPAAHADAEGVPDSLPESAPNFSGFGTGRRETQATEERVTIRDGPWAGGTTMHLSQLQLSLDSWWERPASEQVAQLFGPDFEPSEIDMDPSLPFSDKVEEHAAEEGVVGHFEKAARARDENGEPRLLRRDFDSADGGHAGTEFLSFQRELQDFERVRDAMNGWWLRDESSQITDRTNNGILEFITVRSRANFYVPPRDERAFPGSG